MIATQRLGSQVSAGSKNLAEQDYPGTGSQYWDASDCHEDHHKWLADKRFLVGSCAMKRIIFLSIFVLMGCQSAPPGSVVNISSLFPEATITKSVPASINTLQLNQQCPHFCWMGMNPGVTTFQEAETILSTSNQIDPKWLRVSATGILAVWNTHINPLQPFPCNVSIVIENGMVKTISFGSLPFRIKDFTNRIGEPDKISIALVKAAERDFVTYAIYFSSRKVLIVVSPGDLTGPDSNDYIFEMYLNTEFTKATLPSWYELGPIGPWLGYGHIKDYLPGVYIPPTNQP